MEEQELVDSSLEALEAIEETLEENGAHSSHKWTQWAALASAIMATLGAITALLATFAAHEAVITETKVANEWARYQAKSIKANVIETQIFLLEALDKTVSDERRNTINKYSDEMAAIAQTAHKLTQNSAFYFDQHHNFAISLTLFQVGIALCAISVLSKQKYVLGLGLTFSLLAIFFFIKGGPISHPPDAHAEVVSQLSSDYIVEKKEQNQLQITQLGHVTFQPV